MKESCSMGRQEYIRIMDEWHNIGPEELFGQRKPWSSRSLVSFASSVSKIEDTIVGHVPVCWL